MSRLFPGKLLPRELVGKIHFKNQVFSKFESTSLIFSLFSSFSNYQRLFCPLLLYLFLVSPCFLIFKCIPLLAKIFNKKIKDQAEFGEVRYQILLLRIMAWILFLKHRISRSIICFYIPLPWDCFWILHYFLSRELLKLHVTCNSS